MILETPPGYRALDEHALPATLAGLPAVALRLGGDAARWRVREVGDGNLNLVFLVDGPDGGVAVKQALPYVRLVGESWPLPLSRAFFEHEALTEEARHVPDRVPRVYHYDDTLALTVMELLEPHIIMRKGMIAGIRYPQFADHITTFLAETLFHTSDLGLPAAEKKRRIAVFAGNAALCRITEDLIFTDPYRIAPLNRWTAPHLDAAAAALRADGPAKAAVTELKRLFLSSAEALVHGDLHTGSIMVTPTDTKVIDPEFAFYGPMGFDIGAVIGNLLLSYFSQDGHAAAPGERDGYKGWILDQVEAVWTGFDRKFLALWRAGAPGDLVNPDLFADPACIGALESFRVATLARLFAESTGFAAAKMIRRILGLAHVLDLESIADPARRAACEERALTLARDMLVNRSSYVTVKDIVSRAAAVAGESAGAKG